MDQRGEADAWQEYLAQTRDIRSGKKYERIESFAWAQLQARLGNLKPARRAA